MAKIKKLGDSDDDEDTKAWVAKTRKMDEERKKAEKKVMTFCVYNHLSFTLKR